MLHLCDYSFSGDVLLDGYEEASFSTLRYGCVCLDIVGGPNSRRDLISKFCEKLLEDYKRIFAPGLDAGGTIIPPPPICQGSLLGSTGTCPYTWADVKIDCENFDCALRRFSLCLDWSPMHLSDFVLFAWFPYCLNAWVPAFLLECGTSNMCEWLDLVSVTLSNVRIAYLFLANDLWAVLCG